MPYDEMVLVDTVFFHDIPKDYKDKDGYKFKLVGQLMYADTAIDEPVLDENGNPITNEIEFQYLAKEDNKLMEFDLDATGMEGRTLVIYETLYFDKDESIRTRMTIINKFTSLRYLQNFWEKRVNIT